jgi:ubiquinone/menaquinone biosynthesis C-methylase UbiE
MSQDDELTRVREGYDRWSEVYDHDQNPLTALEEPRVRAAVGEVVGKSVLDLGCGTGRHTTWLAAGGAAVTALDFSEGMLREARRKSGLEKVRFIAHDLHEPLPFADGAFDLVVSGLVLEHLRDLRAFFREARRVVRAGGRAVISAMHPAMFLRGSQARFTDPVSSEVVEPGSAPHKLGEIVVAAFAAGFVVDDIHEHSPDLAFAEQFPRAAKYVNWPILVVLELRVATASPAALKRD